MEMFKPRNLGLLFRSFVLHGRLILSASVLGFFALESDPGPDLLPDTEMWPLATEALDGEVLDLGLPKKRSEFLVYGSAAVPKPVKSVPVKVRVGPKTKDLTVIGDRFWKTGGVSATDPSPFTRMKISYANAYGGPDYPKNPFGKGRAPDGDGRKPLPNVQDPRHLVASPDDAPQPAGMTSYPITWPQRTKHLGKIGPNYLVDDWPYFPSGTDDEFFNAAPEDQRLDGFFRGDEKIEIHNMHPERPAIESALPAVRPRLFINQKKNDAEEFREIALTPETLWLFPDRERGLILFRGHTTIADEEFDDVLHALARVESSRDEALPLEHYRQEFEALLNPAPEEEAQAPAEEETPAAQAQAEPEQAGAPAPDEEEDDPERAAFVKKLDALKAQAFAKLTQLGLDPEEVLRRHMPPEEPGVDFLKQDPEKMLAELNERTQATLKKMNLTEEELLKKIDLPAGRPTTFAEVLENMKAAGVDNPELEASLVQLAQLEKEIPADEEPEEEPTAPMEDRARPDSPTTAAEALAWHQEGKGLAGLDLSGFDFSGMDLSGADFENAVLEGAVFKEANLGGAIFTGAVMLKADFTSANLQSARLNDVTAVEATFTRAGMGGADLTGGDFSKADFTAADLNQASAGETDFNMAKMEKIKAAGLSGAKADFSEAVLKEADFEGADLAETDFSDADLTAAVFRGVRAEGLRLIGVQGEKADFQNAGLVSSRAGKTTNFTRARFDRADLTRAAWEGAQLPGAELSGAILDRADFSRTDLSSARLTRTSAKQTEFMKANLNGANLSRANLFKGSLRKADLVRTDLTASNLYGVDFYKAKLGDTKMSQANLKNTLLTLKP